MCQDGSNGAVQFLFSWPIGLEFFGAKTKRHALAACLLDSAAQVGLINHRICQGLHVFDPDVWLVRSAAEHPTLVTDSEGWQALWFQMEILNALALAEWEEEGSPQDWSHRWREGYEQDARTLVPELIALIISPESSE